MSKIARRNQDWYEQASAAQRKWSNQAAKNLEYYFGAHWTSEQKKILLERGQTPVAIQAMYQVVEQAVGILTANSPSFRTTAREDSDRKVAFMWSDLLQWMWQQSRGAWRLTDVVRDCYVQGRGVAAVYPDWDGDFGKGEVVWKDLDPKEVYPDPRSTDPLWDDAAYVLTRRLMTLHQVRDTWGDEVAEEVRKGGKREEGSYGWEASMYAHHDQVIHPWDVETVWDGKSERYEIIEVYERVRRPHYRLFNPATAREEILTEADYTERRNAPAYVVLERGVERIVSDPAEVGAMDELFNAFGQVYHLMPLPPQVSPEGQLVQMPPQPMPGPEHMGSIPDSEVQMLPTTIGQLVDEGALPAVRFQRHRIQVSGSSEGVLLYQPFELPTQYYPLVPFPNTANRTPYPVSDVDRLRDLQDLLNKSQSLILAHTASSTNLKVFYPDGSLVDKTLIEQEWSKAGTAMMPYDPAYGLGGGTPGGIVIVTPPPLPSALYENMDRAIALMERIAGVYAVQQGEPTSAPNTYRGTLVMDEFGLRRMKFKLDLLYHSLSRLGQVAVELAQHVYTSEKVIRILQPTGVEKEVSVNALQYNEMTGDASRINDITVGQYDVMVVAGSTLPSNRWARLDTYLQLYERGLVDDVAVLRGTELPDAEEILERRSLMQQQAQALEQYQAKIQELEGDLQTKQREAQHANEKAELEKFKSRVKGFEQEVKKSVDLFRFTVDNERAAETRRQQQATSAREKAATPAA